MSDLEKIIAFAQDLAALDRMQANYPPDSKCGKAVAECLKAFQEHQALLNPFPGRATAKPERKAASKS